MRRLWAASRVPLTRPSAIFSPALRVGANRSTLVDNERAFSPAKLRKLVQFVHRRGVTAEEVLDDTGIERNALDGSELRISIRQLAQAYRNIRRLAGDAPWAVQFGRELGLTDYGFYGYALICSPTLRKALEFAIKYHQLAAPTVYMEFVPQTGRGLCALRIEDRLRDPEIYLFNIEIQFGLIFSLFRDSVGPDFRFHHVSLRYPEPPYHEALAQILECPIEFQADTNSAHFSADALDAPLRRANLATWQATREICDDLLQRTGSRTCITQSVYEAMIGETIRLRSIDEVAADLGLSQRTLRRRLAEKHTSFRQIRSEILGALAKEFVTNTHMTAGEIAERLGFSDASSFCKAFGKWAGSGMNEFRLRGRRNDPADRSQRADDIKRDSRDVI